MRNSYNIIYLRECNKRQLIRWTNKKKIKRQTK